LTPIVTKISFASFSARRGPPTPKLPRFRPWCLFALHWAKISRRSHHPASRYPQPYKQKTKKRTANLISRRTLRCMRDKKHRANNFIHMPISLPFSRATKLCMASRGWHNHLCQISYKLVKGLKRPSPLTWHSALQHSTLAANTRH